MIVYWNGKIKSGSVSELPVSTVDLLPTICAMTKTALPKTKIDGRDISQAIYGKKIREVPLYWHFPHYREPDILPYSIIRDGEWKLIKRYEGETFELYNLKNDLSEKNDLVKENPELVKTLNSKLEKWLKDTNARLPQKKQ